MYSEPMPRRALLALLLALPSLSPAQIRAARVVISPVGAAPLPPLALPGARLSAPSVTPPAAALSALSPEPVPSAVLSAPLAAPLLAAPPAADEAPRVPGAPGAPKLDGDPGRFPGVDDPARGAPTLREWLRRYGKADQHEAAVKLAAAAFDGRGQVRADDGTPFEAVADAGSVHGVRFVRAGAGPSEARPGRPVPGTDGLSGRLLLEAVGRAAAAGQRTHEYDEASDYLFSQADNVTLGGVRGVVDAYSGVFVAGSSPDGRDYPEPGDRNHDGHVDEGMNVEHVWPQSRFARKLPYRSDLHHLMATFIHPNGVRANLPFGMVSGRPAYANDAGTKSDGAVFEPADFSKGRVARAMLYFFARYREQSIHQSGGPAWWDRQIDLMLDWNRRFPPDEGERARNDKVERFQGNRNPFVDDPGLADRIGREAFRPSLPRGARARDVRKRGPPQASGLRRSGRTPGRER